MYANPFIRRVACPTANMTTRSTEAKCTKNHTTKPTFSTRVTKQNSSRNFSSVNVSDQRSVTELHTQEQQNDLIIAAALTSMRKSPVLSPACHATPPSSTDSRYCRAGKAGVGVNSSMGVSAGHQERRAWSHKIRHNARKQF